MAQATRAAAGPQASLPERAEALGRTTLLCRLDQDTLLELAACAEQRHYARGDLLVVQGEPGGSVLVLLHGAVTVFRDRPGGRAALSHLQAPAVLGELTLLDGSRRTASAEATEPSSALTLHRGQLLACARRDPALLEGLLVALGGLVRRLSDRTADATLLDLPGRVAKLLLLLAGGGRGPQVVHLSQSRLAELAMCSRQSLNLALGDFAGRGLLHHEGRDIVLDDLGALHRRAGLPCAPRGQP